MRYTARIVQLYCTAEHTILASWIATHETFDENWLIPLISMNDQQKLLKVRFDRTKQLRQRMPSYFPMQNQKLQTYFKVTARSKTTNMAANQNSGLCMPILDSPMELTTTSLMSKESAPWLLGSCLRWIVTSLLEEGTPFCCRYLCWHHTVSMPKKWLSWSHLPNLYFPWW